MATLWSCPQSDCPPTEIATVDVPASGEAVGSESERPFTTDEVAALLNVPLDTIYQWHKEGTGLRVIRCTRRVNTEGVTWSGGWRSKG